MQRMNVLAVIPARGGSKGIPGKNIKPLHGKPLIAYTIEFVRSLFDERNICLSTDDEAIRKVASEYGLKAPFLRPKHLAEDNSSTYDVLMHAIDFFEKAGQTYDALALFQPTSPFRLRKHYTEALSVFDKETDLVMSVTRTKSNPYYLLMEEDNAGYLKKSKEGNFTTRQEVPDVYEINGSIYIYNIASLKQHGSTASFKKMKKYMMDDIYRVDIDDMTDWLYAEFLLEKTLIEFDT